MKFQLPEVPLRAKQSDTRNRSVLNLKKLGNSGTRPQKVADLQEQRFKQTKEGDKNRHYSGVEVGELNTSATSE